MMDAVSMPGILAELPGVDMAGKQGGNEKTRPIRGPGWVPPLPGNQVPHPEAGFLASRPSLADWRRSYCPCGQQGNKSENSDFFVGIFLQGSAGEIGSYKG